MEAIEADGRPVSMGGIADVLVRKILQRKKESKGERRQIS
jgi:hypothetical protein